MRVNPLHESTCHNRIGMYREGQCTDGPHPCTFLGECDQHYIPETGDWDYPDPLASSPHRRHKRPIKSRRVNGPIQRSRRINNRRWYLIHQGKATAIPIRTNLPQAIKKAGL